MQQTFAGHGIHFRYPSDWELSEQCTGNQISLTLNSPGTGFWSVTVFRDAPSAEEVLGTVLDAFQEEYDDLDIYEAEGTLCELPTLSRDLDFFCLELLNSATVRVCGTDHLTLLVLYQAFDREYDDLAETFEAISDSLSLEGDEFPCGCPDHEHD